MHNRIYVTGVQGVGKTTISSLWASRMPGLRAFDGSSILLWYANGCRTSGKFKSIEAVPEAALDEARINALKTFLAQESDVIVAGHARITPEEAVAFDTCVHLVAPAEMIVRFRERDAVRNALRPRVPLGTAEIERASNEYRTRISTLFPIEKIIEVDNSGKPEDTIRTIHEKLSKNVIPSR